MTDTLEDAVGILQGKLEGNGLDGSIKIDVADTGCIRIEGETAELSDADADCTLSADFETLQGLFDGSVNPTMAFMGGKLSVDGDMGIAMKLAGLFG